MQVLKTIIKGYSINVLFTGLKYFFLEDHKGIIAIAERKDFNDNINNFIIYVGNKSCWGDSLCDSTVITYVRKFITIHQNKVKKHDLKFIIDNMDLVHYSLNIEAIKNL